MNAPPSTEQTPYHEFRIVLYRRTADGIEASVAESQMGNSGKVTLQMLIEPSEIDDAFSTIANSSRYIKRSTGRQLHDPVTSIGQRLYKALIDSEVGYIYRASLDRARSSGARLRLRFVFEEQALAAIPIEFLYGERDFLALSPMTAIVRQVRAGGQLPAPVASPPLKVLIAAGETPDEVGALTSLISGSSLLQLSDVLESPTPETVRIALANHQPHILHVCSLLNWHFASTDLEREITGIFATWAPSFLFLNTGHTETLAYSLSSLMPAVIGVRSDITENSRAAFADGVYSALGRGTPLEGAVTEGRQAIDRRQPGSFEWTLPVFYLQAPAGNLLSQASPSAGYESVQVKASVAPGASSSSRKRQALELQLEMLEEQRTALEQQAKNPSASDTKTPVDQILEDINRQIDDLRAAISQLPD